MTPDVIESMFKKGALTGTLLITGKNEEELSTCALQIAKALFGKNHLSKIEKGIHPDIHFYTPEGKTGTHNIASIRSLIDEMQMPPFEAARKVFIIQDAERMLPVSSNALLKTFEEPNLDALLILLTQHPENLLPTIASRCRSFDLHSMEQPDEPHALLIEILSEKKLHPDLLKALDQLDEALFDEDAPALRPKKADLLFDQILKWYRDRTLLASGCPTEYLFYPQHLCQLQKAATLPLPSLEKTLSQLTHCRLGFDRHMRLSTCLEQFLNSVH